MCLPEITVFLGMMLKRHRNLRNPGNYAAAHLSQIIEYSKTRSSNIHHPMKLVAEEVCEPDDV
jgi:hypothetical protein